MNQCETVFYLIIRKIQTPVLNLLLISVKLDCVCLEFILIQCSLGMFFFEIVTTVRVEITVIFFSFSRIVLIHVLFEDKNVPQICFFLTA